MTLVSRPKPGVCRIKIIAPCHLPRCGLATKFRVGRRLGRCPVQSLSFPSKVGLTQAENESTTRVSLVLEQCERVADNHGALEPLERSRMSDGPVIGVVADAPIERLYPLTLFKGEPQMIDRTVWVRPTNDAHNPPSHRLILAKGFLPRRGRAVGAKPAKLPRRRSFQRGLDRAQLIRPTCPGLRKRGASPALKPVRRHASGRPRGSATPGARPPNLQAVSHSEVSRSA